MGAIANAMKKFVTGIRMAIKFFAGAIGHVVLYVIGAIILVILVWLIVTVIADSIGKLIGVTDNLSSIPTSEADAQFLAALQSSGYDAMLDATELTNYYTFEYSVLMDAARFLEETGSTEMIKEDNGIYDYRKISRAEWAALAANGFAIDGQIEADSLVKHGYVQGGTGDNIDADEDSANPYAGATPGTIDPEEDQYNYHTGVTETVAGQEIQDEHRKGFGVVQGDEKTESIYHTQTTEGVIQAYNASGEMIDENGDVIPSGNQLDPTTTFSTERSSGDLWYKPEFNEYTQKNLLAPYLKIVRTDDTLRYYFEIKNLTGTNMYDDDLHWQYGGYFNFDALPTDGKNLADDNGVRKGTWIFGQKFRFQKGVSVKNADKEKEGAKAEDAAKFIYNHIFPFGFNAEINQNNESAFSTKDTRYSKDIGICDLDKDYSWGDADTDTYNSIYYAQQESFINYNVPIRVLLDRFLPNAQLLASWRHLRESESLNEVGYSVSTTVVNEILKMYNEACLSGEEIDGSKLLVKDVGYVKSVISKDSNALTYLGEGNYVPSKEICVDNYSVGGNESTTVYYGSYASVYDTRKSTGDDSESGDAFKQPFSGDIVDEIKDDVRLALTHYFNSHAKDFIDDKDKTASDFANVLDEFFNQYESEITTGEGNTKAYSGPDMKEFTSREFIVYRKEGSAYATRCSAIKVDDLTTAKDHFDIPSSINLELKDIKKSPPTDVVTYEEGSTKKTATHKYSDNVYDKDNPYATNKKDDGCFVPYLRVAWKVKNNIKTTAVVICNESGYAKFVYLVSGKEIDDVANISNKETFAKFEATDLISTTFKNWEFANKREGWKESEGLEKSYENWIVTDAFEGLGFNADLFEKDSPEATTLNPKIHFYITIRKQHPNCGHYKIVSYDDDNNPIIEYCPNIGKYKFTDIDHETDGTLLYSEDNSLHEAVPNNWLDVLGISDVKTAQFLIPYYDALIQEEMLWGKDKRDYAVIRTPKDKDGGEVDYTYADEKQNNLRTGGSTYYSTMPPAEYDEDNNFQSGVGSKVTKDLEHKFGEGGEQEILYAGQFPQDGFIINDEQIPEYEGLDSGDIRDKGAGEADGGEAVDPRKIYLKNKELPVLTNEVFQEDPTYGVFNNKQTFNQMVEIFLGPNSGKDDPERPLWQIPNNPQKLDAKEYLVREICWTGIDRYIGLEEYYYPTPKEQITSAMIKTYMDNLRLKPGAEEDRCPHTDYNCNCYLINPTLCFGWKTEHEAYVAESTPDLYQQEPKAFKVDPMNPEQCFSAVFPVRIAVSPVTQRVVTKEMNAYFVKEANYWAANKKFRNIELITGEFVRAKGDWENYHYLITNNSDAQGLRDIKSSYKNVNWRCKFFAPIFGADKDEKNKTRENDVRLIITEWEEIGNQNVHAADHYIRDIYSLIKYSQGFQYSGDGADDVKWDAVLDGDGNPYIHPDSYQFFYIPDEILQYEPLNCEKAFWMDRIICTQNDAINEDFENVMRSRLPTFTWQQVDYDDYDETYVSSGTDSQGNEVDIHAAYAMWLFGGQSCRNLYVFASSATPKEHDMVPKWGAFNAAHMADDLYGRNQTGQIYDSVMSGKEEDSSEVVKVNENYGYVYYPKQGNTAVIKAGFDDDGVFLYSGTEFDDSSKRRNGFNPSSTFDRTSGEFENFGDAEALYGDDGTPGNVNANVSGITFRHEENLDEVKQGTLYFKDTPVTITMGKTRYNFTSPGSAVYGYMLYRQALVENDAEHAEKIVKRQLEKELKWNEVRSVAPGYVTGIGGDAVSGFWVKISHTAPVDTTSRSAKLKSRNASSVSTSYAHMKRYPVVQVGQYVGAGTLIGYEGTTGKSGGYHTHMTLKLGSGRGKATNPIKFMYPFFTPFWYEEKAQDEVAQAGSVAGALGSEYYSLERTVWPFGMTDGAGTSFQSSITSGITADRAIKDDNLGGPNSESGMVKIDNYTPKYALVPDTSLLPTEGVVDYSKLPVSHVSATAGGTKYDRELVAIPDYAEPDFIEKVKENNYKIHGLPIGIANNP